MEKIVKILSIYSSRKISLASITDENDNVHYIERNTLLRYNDYAALLGEVADFISENNIENKITKVSLTFEGGVMTAANFHD